MNSKPLVDRLVRLAMAILAIAVALYLAVQLLESIAGVLIGIAVVVAASYLGWQWWVRRRSDW